MEGGVRFRVRFGAAPTETGETSAQPGKTHLRSPRLLWSRVSKTVRLQLAVSNCFAKAIDAALCDGHQQHAGYLHKLKVGVLTRAQVARVVGDKRIETTQEELRAKIAAGRVVVQASSEAELNAVEFWQQGDVDLSTAENLKARHRLKSDESVRAALHAWWAAVKANGLLTEDAAEPVLRREGYEIIFLRFHKLLLDTWNYDEAKATVAEDWIEDLGDSERSGGMPQEVFFASLFELADLWTPSIDAAVYAEFLRRLLASCLEADGKLCSLDAVAFDSALTSDKSERKPRKSKSRRAERHAQAVERQKAATRIQAHGRRKIEAREVENRRKAAKLITSRARAGIQGRKVRRELPPKPQAPVLVRPLEDASGEPQDSFRSRVSNARLCASPTSERSGPFSRRESMPYPSIPGQLGKWQPWKLRTEIVDVVEETLLERRALHDDERYRAASKRRGMMADQRKASLAARRAKLAEEERQRAARRARLENERQALRVEELLAKDKKQHDAHMAARQSSWQSELLTFRHEAEVPPPAVTVKYAAQHASVAPMTPALRPALTTCGSSDSASHEPPSPAKSSGAKIKWRRSPSAPEAALHRIRSAGTLSTGAMSGSLSLAAVSGTLSSAHPLSSGCAKRMPARAQTASCLECLRRSAEQLLEEGATSPRKADCPEEGRPSRGRLASSEEHRALLQGAQRLQNPHPSRSPFWRVRDALEDLGTEVTWRPAPVYGEPPAKWLHQVLPTPFFSI